MMHRDLKPGNIMLTKTGAKLLDFGLAKATARRGLSRPRADGTMGLRQAASRYRRRAPWSGTLQYMSPEQLEGKEADARSRHIRVRRGYLRNGDRAGSAFEGKSQLSLMSGHSGEGAGADFDRQSTDGRRCSTTFCGDVWLRILRSAGNRRKISSWELGVGKAIGGRRQRRPVIAVGKSKSSRVMVLAAVLAVTLVMVLLALGYFFVPSEDRFCMWANLNLAGELTDEEGDFTMLAGWAEGGLCGGDGGRRA